MKIRRTIVWTESDCDEALEVLSKSSLIANDIETIPFQKKFRDYPFVMTVNSYTGLVDGMLHSYCFPFQRGKGAQSGAPIHIEKIYSTCRALNESGIPFTGHNYVYDLMWFLRYGLPVSNWAFDSMIMFWSKWPELPKTLDFVSSILLDSYQYWKAGRKDDDFVKYCEYAMSDTENTILNTMKLIDMMIQDDQMRENFFHAHLRCIAGLAMSAKGMRANTDTLGEFNSILTEKKDIAIKRVRYLVADPEFNPNSAPQKSELIYNLLGARKRNAKGRFVTKDKDASTGAIPLRAMRNDHPIFRRIANGILEALEPAKQISNVVNLPLFPNPNGSYPRFLTSYDGVGTITTRLSSRASAFGHGGNAQNIRKDYRRFLEADSDSFLLDIDYSGADDVFVAFESREPKKMDLIRSGKDIHATNALIFFGNWTYDQIVEGKRAGDPRIVHPITGIRQITKKLVHGCHYLMAAITLLMTANREAIVAAAQEIGHEDAGYWTQDKLIKFCQLLEQKFRDHYPRFKRGGSDSWYTELRENVKKSDGVFTTIFNYHERFLGDLDDDSTLRGVAATAGQANTAGRINMAMEELILGIRTRRFRDGPAPDADDPPLVISEAAHGVSLRLQTHDSFTFNIRHTHPNWREGVKRIFRVMSRPVVCKGETFTVGTEAEVSYEWAGKKDRLREVKPKEAIGEAEKFLAEVRR